MRTRAGAERQNDVGELLVRAHLVGRRARHVEDLAAQRQDCLDLAVTCLLGRASGAVAFDEKDLSAQGTVAGAVGELARQAQLAGRGLACQLTLLAPPLALLGPFRDAVEEQPRGRRICAQPMIEMILDGILYEPGLLDRGEPLLGL